MPRSDELALCLIPTTLERGPGITGGLLPGTRDLETQRTSAELQLPLRGVGCFLQFSFL